VYRVEKWGARGITTEEVATKREANALAELMRNDPQCSQTNVVFPNGKIRVCKTRHAAK